MAAMSMAGCRRHENMSRGGMNMPGMNMAPAART